MEALIGLVDKSVVQRIGEHGERYRLLDTIREYGAEWLAEVGGADEVRRRHFAVYDDLAERFWSQLVSPAQVALHRAVREETADIRAALAHGCAVDDLAPRALWLATRLGPYWRAAGTLSEGAALDRTRSGAGPGRLPRAGLGAAHDRRHGDLGR